MKFPGTVIAFTVKFITNYAVKLMVKMNKNSANRWRGVKDNFSVSEKVNETAEEKSKDLNKIVHLTKERGTHFHMSSGFLIIAR